MIVGVVGVVIGVVEEDIKAFGNMVVGVVITVIVVVGGGNTKVAGFVTYT